MRTNRLTISLYKKRSIFESCTDYRGSHPREGVAPLAKSHQPEHLLDKHRSPFSLIRPINIMASFTAAVEHIRTYSMLNMLTNHIPTPSFTSLLVLLTMGLAAMALYVTCLYVRLSRMKSARPFEEIPTVPSVQ